MKQTENISLKTFEATDKFDYKVLNENAEIIDDEIGNCVQKTDVATLGGEAGLIKLINDYSYGLDIKSGCLVVRGAKEALIEGKKNSYAPIVPSTLDYAVKLGMTTNAIPLTDTEKASAQNWLGVNAKIATGTYTGSGTYGDESKGNVLSFDFIPEIVIVIEKKALGSGEYLIMFNSMGAGFRTAASVNETSKSTTTCSVKWNDTNKTVTWYDSIADYQMNSTSTTYKWIAIGR